MANSPRRIYWDTGPFLEFFRQDTQSAHYAAVMDGLARAKAGELQIVTSVIAIAEAAFVNSREWEHKRFVGGALEDMDALWQDYPAVLPIACSTWIAFKAREMRRWQLANSVNKVENNDLLHLATAIFAKATAIHVIEKRWSAFEPFVGIPISAPPPPAAKPPELPFPSDAEADPI